MATAKKLPSGSWRVRVYSHKDMNGKKVYESFTAPTKREAEIRAAEWANKRERRSRSDLSIKEALQGYINAKEGVLSLFPCALKTSQPCGFERFFIAIFGAFLPKIYSPLYKGFSRL